MTVREINRFFLLASAPFVGMIVWLIIAGFSIEAPKLTFAPLQLFTLQNEATSIHLGLDQAGTNVSAIRDTIAKFHELYEKSASLSSASRRSSKRSDSTGNNPQNTIGLTSR